MGESKQYNGCPATQDSYSVQGQSIVLTHPGITSVNHIGKGNKYSIVNLLNSPIKRRCSSYKWNAIYNSAFSLRSCFLCQNHRGLSNSRSTPQHQKQRIEVSRNPFPITASHINNIEKSNHSGLFRSSPKTIRIDVDVDGRPFANKNTSGVRTPL